MDRLLTSAEVAEILRVHPVTVRRWRRKGLLTGVPTPGGQWRYKLSELRKLMEESSE